MGGGNAQKSKTSRERKLAKDAAAGKGELLIRSQLEKNKAALTIKCNICMQTFICTTTASKCKEHSDNRHPKNTLEECFPHLAS
eukprot:jgi/Chlat1/2129/Chrsp17S02716